MNVILYDSLRKLHEAAFRSPQLLSLPTNGKENKDLSVELSTLPVFFWSRFPGGLWRSESGTGKAKISQPITPGKGADCLDKREWINAGLILAFDKVGCRSYPTETHTSTIFSQVAAHKKDSLIGSRLSDYSNIFGNGRRIITVL